MCRNALGVHRQATELIVKSELGRYPVTTTIVCKIINYHQHLLTSRKNSLIGLTLKPPNTDKSQQNCLHRVTKLLHTLDQPKCLDQMLTKSQLEALTKRTWNKVQELYKTNFFDILAFKSTSPVSAGRFEIYIKLKRYADLKSISS